MKYLAKLTMKEYYTLEIEADSLTQAEDIANITDLEYWNEDRLTTEDLEVELIN